MIRRLQGYLLVLNFVAVCLVGCIDSDNFAPPPATRPVESSDAVSQMALPNEPDSLKFAVIGDTGTGGSAQRRIGEAMYRYHQQFPFVFALMAGDNMYGSERPRDFEEKFERPYRTLIDRGVKFYAALGNHDEPNQRFYRLFNMGGERYHSFKPSDSVRIFVLDSGYMDPEQVKWIARELKSSNSPWKIALFHHPLYSSAGRHGSDLELRKVLEPLFVEHGVDVVLAGHDHVYERTKPRKGITHFVVGNSAKLRRGNLRQSDITAAGYDAGYGFLLAEIIDDRLYFQAFNERHRAIDQGTIRERSALNPAKENQ